MPHLLFTLGCFVLGIVFGYIAPRPIEKHSVDLTEENVKLRKENQYLWRKIRALKVKKN